MRVANGFRFLGVLFYLAIAVLLITTAGCGGEDTYPAVITNASLCHATVITEGKEVVVVVTVPNGGLAHGVVVHWDRDVRDTEYGDVCCSWTNVTGGMGLTWAGTPKGDHYTIREAGKDPMHHGVYKLVIPFLKAAPMATKVVVLK